jgi:hypothetical protein
VSVTANFENGGFEFDFIIEANSLADAYERMGEFVRMVEQVGPWEPFTSGKAESVIATSATSAAPLCWRSRPAASAPTIDPDNQVLALRRDRERPCFSRFNAAPCVWRA